MVQLPEHDAYTDNIRERDAGEAPVEESNRTHSANVSLLDLDGVPAERVSDSPRIGNGLIPLLHCGGLASGSPRTHRGLAASMSRAAGRDVVVIDYRLAPVHPFPAAIDDAVVAYRALLELDHDPARIAVAGDSAGAALAAALLTRLRDPGIALPAAGVLISPWLDLTLSGSTISSLAPDFNRRRTCIWLVSIPRTLRPRHYSQISVDCAVHDPRWRTRDSAR